MNIIPYLLSGLLCCSTAAAAVNPTVQDDLAARRAELPRPAVIDSIATAGLTPEQREALEFLYAYMPPVDIASYPLDFFRSQVDASLQARAEMPWGRRVPEREFRHFVLPPRVNNEALDLARPVFYNELKDRVRGLSMTEAILEVNHWCHEKVTYKPSDPRTSPPLSTLSQAIGRCGEESTFTVAALRAVGIPARQVYTPRWAHTDDNHAWVEAWADGRWYFLGACEPEPILNLAWFNAPAARGMLMATNVIGRYDGPEEVIYSSPRVTRINVTANYAPVDTLRVRAAYADGSPARNARVRFGIYNYAEFYPVATKTADEGGRACLTTGLGDMVVWATDGRAFGFAKVRPDGGEASVVLRRPEAYTQAVELDITPPQPSGQLPRATDEQRRANDLRFHYEDSVRTAYEATFFKAGDRLPRPLADRLDEAERASVAKALTLARGNHATLLAFLDSCSDARLSAAVALLASLEEKDLRDIPLAVLRDCIDRAPAQAADMPDGLYLDYVVAPRVLWEPLSPTKAFFDSILSGRQRKRFAQDPLRLVKFVTDAIAPLGSADPIRLQSTPAGVWAQRTADPVSRSIFFVQAARACGIPARIESMTGKTQFARTDGQGRAVWYDVLGPQTEADGAVTAPQGRLHLTFTPTRYIVEPRYYYQFAIARITDGVPATLEMDEGRPFGEQFGRPLALDTGRYMLVTGQRMANGTVLARIEFFDIREGQTTELALRFRHDDSQPSVIGNLNAEDLYFDLATGTEKSILSTTGRGYYVLGIIHPNQEPTVHAINELSALRNELDETGNQAILLFTDREAAARFRHDKYGELPASLHFGVDTDGKIADEIAASLHLEHADRLPLMVVADSFNRIVYVSQGYSIGLAERLLQTLRKVNDPQ